MVFMPSLTRRALAAVLIVASVTAALFLGIVLGRRSRTPARSDSAPVVEAVRKVAKLATVEMEVADVVHYEEVRQIVVFDIPKNATLRLRGTVLGGFDLKDRFSVIAEPATKTIRIDLPPPQVLSVDARIEWFDERSGWLNPITPEDRTRWTAWGRGALGRAAKSAGLLDRSSANMRELLTETATALGWRAVVTFEGRKSPAL